MYFPAVVPSPVHPDLLEPEDFPVRFGRYTLIEVLGEGGMARVFRAELEGPSGFRKPAALKVIRASVTARDENRRAALVAEARLGGLLHHPNIVETYDYGEEGETPWIAMELVDGLGLDAALLDGPVPPGVAIEIAAQVCRGLHHAHDALDRGLPAGLVHRDLKPSNVIVSRDGLAKVMDFGIAKATRIVGAATEEGLTKGTPAYMSPEQASAHPLDRRSDIFAMGLLIHELVMGFSFFEGRTLMSLLMEIVHVEDRLAAPDALTALDVAVPGLGGVVRACLRADRDLRWADAAALEAGLRGLQDTHPPERPLGEWVDSIRPPVPRSSLDHLQTLRTGPPATPAPPVRGAARPTPLPATRAMSVSSMEVPVARGVAGLVAVAALLAGVALRLTVCAPPPPAVVVDEAPAAVAAPALPEVQLGPGEARIEASPGAAVERPAATPSPAPTPAPVAGPASPTPEPAPPPAPRIGLDHAPAPEALVGSANTVSVTLDGDPMVCGPVLHWGPWSASGPSDYAARPMATTGGGRFAVDVFIPYAEDYAAGFQYFIACRSRDGRILARSPDGGGTHRIPALAR